MKDLPPLVRAMLAAGYVVSPNNIHSLRGVIMYAGGPGIPEPLKSMDVQVDTDRIRVFSLKMFGTPCTRTCFWDTVTEAVFDEVPAFLAWCKEHGAISEPGLPAFSNSWD